MAKQIKRTDIAEEDLFKGVRDSASKTLADIGKLNTALKESATLLSTEIKSNKLANTSDINKFVAAVKEAQQLQKQAVELNKAEENAIKNKAKAANELKKIEAEKLKTDRILLKERRLLNAEEERAAKAAAKVAKAANDEKNAYKKLVKETREYKNESKRLAVELIKLEQAGKRNSAEYRKLAGTYRKVTKAAQAGDKTLKRIDKTVGDNFRNVGNYTSALGKLRSGLAQLGLAFGAFSLLKDAGRTVVEFDQAVANLVSITGASGQDLEFFKKQAREIGTTVEGGAAAVIEGYQLIGSARPELLKNAQALNEVTKSAVTLSQASGLELPDAAKRLTDAMNQFNVPVSEAARVVDVLANASLEGSALIPEVTDAMLKFGAAANSSNVSVEESAALIEALASKGIKGAEAGTKLRNIMLKLSAPDALPKEAQKALERLGISFEDLNDESKPFSKRLEALKPLLEDSAALQKVFGEENAIAATNLIGLTDEVDRLTDAMKTQGTAADQAKTNTETISGAFTELKNSWANFVLEMNEGAGIGELVRRGLLFLANNLSTIITVLGKAIRLFITYKAVMAGLKLRDRAKEFLDYRKAIKSSNDELKKGSSGVRKFGQSLKGIGLATAINLVFELAAAWWDVASGAKAAREAQAAVEKIQKKAAEFSAKRSQERSEALQKEMAENERKFRREEILEDKLRELNEKAIEQRNDAAKADRKAVDERARAMQTDIDFVKSATKSWNGFRQTIGDGKDVAAALNRLGFKELAKELRGDEWRVGQANLNDFNKALTIAQGKVQANWSKWKVYNEEIEVYSDLLDEAKTQTFETNKEQDEHKKTIARTSQVQQKLNTDFRNTINLLEEVRKNYAELIDLQNQLNEARTSQKIEQYTQQLDEEIELQKERSQTEGGFDFSTIMKLTEERKELEKQAIIDERDARIQAIEDTNALRFQKMREALEEERQQLIAGANGDKDALKQIELNYQAEKRNIDALELDTAQNVQTKIILEKEKANNELLNLEYETNQELEELNKELVDNVTDYALTKQDEADQKLKEKADKALEDEKKRASDRIALINAVTDYLKKKSDERIAQLDKEIQAADDNQKRLEKLADEGNIKAEQSLAQQEKIKAEKERAKLEEEQRQQRLELARVALTTYNGKVEAGSKQPLAETIRDISLLQQFINTLPAFLDGTEDTGANGQGVDGKGGFHAILHPNERVLTKGQNELIGGLSNNELAKVASDYNTGKLVRHGEGALMIGNGWDSAQVIKQLENVEKAIQNQPTNDLHIENVVRGAFDLVKTNKNGNTLIYNRYRLKG